MERTWAATFLTTTMAIAATTAADVTMYNDRDAFLAATRATALDDFPNWGPVRDEHGEGFEHDGVRLTSTEPSYHLEIGFGEEGKDYVPDLPGNEIAMSGPENLNVDFLGAPAAAFGFAFVDSTDATSQYSCGSLCPCAGSPYDFTLLCGGAGGSVVGSGSFERPEGTIAFVGIASTVAFDRIEIRDRRATCEDEYFGRFDVLSRSGRPDCNGDGRLNINDFICFQSEWNRKSAYGDYNGDGKWNINDFIAFQADFRKGCR